MADPAAEKLLYESEAYRLTTHRLIQPGLVAELVSPTCLRITREGCPPQELHLPQVLPEDTPRYRGSIPVLGAVYCMAIWELLQNRTPEGLLLAGANWSTVWTRDIAYAAALGAAAALPECCRASLDARVAEGRVLQDTGTGGGWPVSTDRVVWAMGVWAVYEVLGDDAWLEQCVEVLVRTLEEDARVLRSDSLLRPGETSFLDWRDQSYPDWMTPADIASSYAFGTNVLHYICRRLLARMLRQLGRSEEAEKAAAAATELAAQVRKCFWSNGACRFGMFRTAEGYLDERTDALATALAVLSGLAGEHAQQVLQSLPRSPYGTPVFSPYKSCLPEAYHNRAIWPFVEAYVLLAHAEQQDSTGAGRCLSSMLRAAMAFGTNKENFHAETGAAADTLLNSDRQLWSVAGMLGVFYHGLFGLQYEGNNLVLAPCVPKEYAGSHWLTRLRIRNMVLDIHLNGYGTEVWSVMVNGKPAAPVIPLDTEGHVVVELELMPAEDAETAPPPPRATEDLPTPEWTTPGPKRLVWQEVPGAVSYCVYRDGVAFSTTLEPVCPLAEPTAYHEYSVQAIGAGSLCSSLSRPFCCPLPGSEYSLAPHRVGEEAEYSVEHGQAWLDTRPCTACLRFEEAELPAGTYRLRVLYANATASLRDGDTCALRELQVDGVPAGILLMPHHTEQGAWDAYTHSTALTCRLEAGTHCFELCYTPACVNANGELNQCMVRRLELLRLGD